MNNDGGTPTLDTNLVSQYSTSYHFTRLENYQLRQWTDVTSSKFINWFTVPTTSTKYMLMGKQTMPAGTYEMIVKNVDSTNNDFNKTILVSEVGSLGTTNHLLGFTIFAYGIFYLN